MLKDQMLRVIKAKIISHSLVHMRRLFWNQNQILKM